MAYTLVQTITLMLSLVIQEIWKIICVTKFLLRFHLFPYCLFLPQTLKGFKKNGQIYPGLFHSNIQFLQKLMFFVVNWQMHYTTPWASSSPIIFNEVLNIQDTRNDILNEIKCISIRILAVSCYFMAFMQFLYFTKSNSNVITCYINCCSFAVKYFQI